MFFKLLLFSREIQKFEKSKTTLKTELCNVVTVINEMSSTVKSEPYRDLMSGVSRGTTGLVSDNSHDQYHSIGQVRNQGEPGDILEFQRGSYTHYALYLGDGRVMNINVENERATEAVVQECTLREVCHDGKVRVRNHADVAQAHFQLNPKSPKFIIQAATFYNNKVVPFEFDFRNSEYYCTLWRYGKGFSTQAAKEASACPGPKSGADNTSASFFEGDGYAKYKQLAMNKPEYHNAN